MVPFLPTMTYTRRLTIFFLALYECCFVAFGQYSRSEPCLRAESFIVILWREPLSGNFSIVKRLEQDEIIKIPGVQFRKLYDLDQQDVAEIHSNSLRSEVTATPGILAMEGDGIRDDVFLWPLEGDSNDTSLDSAPLFYAWECSCHSNSSNGIIPTVYCPLAISTCLRPSRSQQESRVPGCRNVPKAYDFHRYSVLFLACWFFMLLASLCTSNVGASLFGYLVSKCYPNYNEQVIDRLLRHHPDRVRHMIRSFLVRQQRALEEMRYQMELARSAAATNEENQGGRQGEDGSPATTGGTSSDTEAKVGTVTSLVLRTTVYKSPCHRPQPNNNNNNNNNNNKSENEDDDDSSSEEGEDTCAICFVAFVDGDRVGCLKCSHRFHKECLKMWLKRRNACPLCQTEEVAEPRYDEIVSDTEESTVRGEDSGDSTSSPS